MHWKKGWQGHYSKAQEETFTMGQEGRTSQKAMNSFPQTIAAASAKLFGVEIINEGFGTSIDDTVIEQQATFVAQTISPLQAVGSSTLISGS
jgi:hypothetical protein